MHIATKYLHSEKYISRSLFSCDLHHGYLAFQKNGTLREDLKKTLYNKSMEYTLSLHFIISNTAIPPEFQQTARVQEFHRCISKIAKQNQNLDLKTTRPHLAATVFHITYL